MAKKPPVNKKKLPDNERYISQTELARRLGIQRAAIGNACLRGRIKKLGAGHAARIDLECPMTKDYISSINSQRIKGNKPPGKPAGAPRKAKPKKVASSPPAPSPNYEQEVFEFGEKKKIELQRAREELEKIELHNKATRFEYIDRDLLQDYMDRLYSIHNGQLKTLGLRASSDVAAILGIEDDALIRSVCEKIDSDMMQILEQIKREMNKFLKSIKAKEINESKAA